MPSTICSYQDINYTMILAHSGNETSLGPYQHHGSDIINRGVSKPHLSEEQEYSLRVLIEAVNGAAESQELFFSK